MTHISYGDILSIIIAAGVFVSGLRALGLIDAFIALLKKSDSMVQRSRNLRAFPTWCY